MIGVAHVREPDYTRSGTPQCSAAFAIATTGHGSRAYCRVVRETPKGQPLGSQDSEGWYPSTAGWEPSDPTVHTFHWPEDCPDAP